MPSENTVYLTGHLGKDPEIKRGQSGKDFAVLSVATSSGKDDKKETQWHNVVAFGFCVEQLHHLKKGDVVAVRGSIAYEKYEKDGETKYVTKIRSWDTYGLDYKRRADQQNQSTDYGKALYQPAPADDDLPF